MRTKAQFQQALIKAKVLTHYGNGKCECVKCGFKDIRALSIDHIDGGGTAERKMGGSGGHQFYKWLANNDYPKGYQTLCMNCQFIKSITKDMLTLAIPQYSIPKQIHKWVEMWDSGQFRIYTIKKALGLQGKDAEKIRAVLFRLTKKGDLTRVSVGCYRKVNRVTPILVE